MLKGFFILCGREWRVACARLGDYLSATMFFVMMASLFPIAISPEPEMLRQLGISVIWIAAMLSVLPTCERCFLEDSQCGWLEQITLSPLSLLSYVLAKMMIFYLITSLPMMIILPVIMLMFALPLSLLPLLGSTLGLGLGCLHLIGIMMAGLTLGARRGGMMLSLATLPLALPILIFGVMTNEAYVMGLPFGAHLQLLGALGLFFAALCPIACVVALRGYLEEGQQT